MSSDDQLALAEEMARCVNCHHCIDIAWMEKIVCTAYLEVRPPVQYGGCPEFVPRKKMAPLGG